MSRFWKQLNTKPFIIILSLLLIILVYLFARQYNTSHSIDKEVAQLQKQADALEKNNEELQSFITYFQTDNYQEKVAREQLSVKKEGEFVYSFADLNTGAITEPVDVQTNVVTASPVVNQNFVVSTMIKKETNSTKWWQYFFGLN